MMDQSLKSGPGPVRSGPALSGPVLKSGPPVGILTGPDRIRALEFEIRIRTGGPDLVLQGFQQGFSQFYRSKRKKPLKFHAHSFKSEYFMLKMQRLLYFLLKICSIRLSLYQIIELAAFYEILYM